MLKIIAKHENNSIILKIKNYMKEKDLNFSFNYTDKAKLSKKMKRYVKNMIFQ